MKSILLSLILVLSISLFAQETESVTLTVSGTGSTQDEAQQNALRSAVEQAFGTFISSNTEILNDELVRDEIVSVSSGNIQEFDIVSEAQLPDGRFASTVKATVSVAKLTSFVESKGGSVEFKGSLFGQNIKIQKLNEEAEYKAILNLCEVSDQMLSQGLDFDVTSSEPVQSRDNIHFEVMISVQVKSNQNYYSFASYFQKTIESIGMNATDIEDYTTLNKPIYNLEISTLVKFDEYPAKKHDKMQVKHLQMLGRSVQIFYEETADGLIHAYKPEENIIYLRNGLSALALENLFLKSNDYLFDFQVFTNKDTIPVTIHRNTRNCNIPEYNNSHDKKTWKLLSTGNGYPPVYMTSWDGRFKTSWEHYWHSLGSDHFSRLLGSKSDYYSTSYSDFWYGEIPENQRPRCNYRPCQYIENVGKLDFSMSVGYTFQYKEVFSDEQLSAISFIKVEKLNK